MKTGFYLLLFIFIFTGCLPEAEQSGDVFETFSEYTNQYTAEGLLEKVIVNRYEVAGKSKELLFNSESLYTYEENELKEIREFRILEDGSRMLESLHLYKEGIEEVYTYDKNEISSYRLSEYDPEKRMRREVRRTEMSYPEFDFMVEDDYEEITFYNTNDEIIHEVKYDYGKRVCQETLKTVKTIEGAIEKECMYDRNDNPLMETHVSTKDSFDIEVTYLHDFLRTDSLYCKEDKEVRKVSISPEEKITTVRTYDERRNVIKEKTRMEFFSIL